MSVYGEPLTLEQARHQANIVHKAASLEQRGYTGRWLTPETVEITGPSGRRYVLDLMARTCDCDGFREHNLCSHIVGYYPLVCTKEVPDA